MKFSPVVPEICRGQVHGARKERRITRTGRRRIIIIIIRNGAKTIRLQTLFGRLNKTPNLSLDDAHVNQLQTTLQWLL
jgi:hypothetical protein